MKKEYEEFRRIRSEQAKITSLTNNVEEKKTGSKNDFESVFTFAKDGQQGNIFEDNNGPVKTLKVELPQIVEE